MSDPTNPLRTRREEAATVPPGGPCTAVLFGASGDRTRRLLVPALYHLACDGLLPKNFAVVGSAKDELTPEQFRDRLSAGVREFTNRPLPRQGDGAELALLYHQPRAASVRALTPCDLTVLSKSDFDHVLQDDPAFATQLHEEAARRYAEVTG